jgi:FkbM family methyltransferase
MIKRILYEVLKKGYRIAGGRPIFAKFPPLSGLIRSAASYALLNREGISLCEIQGHKMYIPANDCLYEYTLNDFEPAVTKAIMNRLRPGDVAIDIGAHIGYHTLVAARQVGKSGKVFAFEPDPENYDLLVKNIKLNSYNNVVAIKKAVSNKTEDTKLFQKSSSTHSLFCGPVQMSSKSVAVQTVSLDDFFSTCPTSLESRIRLIKMDIEGAEMLALLGMSRLVKNRSLTIVSELIPDLIANSGFQPAEYLSKLVEYGFEVRIIGQEDKNVGNIVETIKRGTGVNLLCYKSEYGSNQLEAV